MVLTARDTLVGTWGVIKTALCQTIVRSSAPFSCSQKELPATRVHEEQSVSTSTWDDAKHPEGLIL
jgi:hypothetical protein